MVHIKAMAWGILFAAALAGFFVVTGYTGTPVNLVLLATAFLAFIYFMGRIILLIREG